MLRFTRPSRGERVETVMLPLVCLEGGMTSRGSVSEGDQ